MIDYIRRTIKIINIISTTLYHHIRYKLKLDVYNYSVINICNSLISHSYIFIKNSDRYFIYLLFALLFILYTKVLSSSTGASTIFALGASACFSASN